MKKILIILTLIFAGLLLLVVSIDPNRIGKDNVYVEVIEATDTMEDKLDSGELISRYTYKQKAFDKGGKPVELEFSAGKELRKGAYLMLYVKKGNEVTSYDEVKWNEIPSKAQTELENYYGTIK